MDTDSLYLALVELILYDCIQPDKRATWCKVSKSDCIDTFKAVAKSNLFSRSCCSIGRRHDKQEPRFFK